MVGPVRLRPRRGLCRDSLLLEATLAKAHARSRVSEGWLGGRDSNADDMLQSHASVERKRVRRPRLRSWYVPTRRSAVQAGPQSFVSSCSAAVVQVSLPSGA